MKRKSGRNFLIAALGLLSSCAVSQSLKAQSPQTFYIKARLGLDSQFPAVSVPDAKGSARIKIVVNRDSAGDVTSGAVTFDVGYQFSSTVTLTSLHLHSGAVGEAGPIVIDSGLSSTLDSDGAGNLTMTTPVLSSPEQLATLDGLINSPQLYYVDLHTSDTSTGTLRGQVSTRTYFFKATLSPGSVVPAVGGLDATATALITLDIARDNAGKTTFSTLTMDVSYEFPGKVTFTGIHLNSGGKGQNGDVIIDAGAGGVTEVSGNGRIAKVISLSSSKTIVSMLKSLVSDPRYCYIEVLTTENPAGALRGQLSWFTQLGTIPYSRDDGSYRSNLGIHNLADLPGFVLVGLYSKEGDLIQEKSIFVPARAFVQLPNINRWFGNSTAEGALELEADQHTEAFVSLIENGNDFPTIIPLTATALRFAVASVTNTGKFRSSLIICNQGDMPATVDILARGIDGVVMGQKKSITISSSGFFVDPDILTFLGVSNSYGPLEVRSTNNQPISVVSRVYSCADNRGGLLIGKEF